MTDQLNVESYKILIEGGVGKGTHLHAAGDGATRIADQIDEPFGAQGGYLIEFYHLCDYLAAAAKSCVRIRMRKHGWTNKKTG